MIDANRSKKNDELIKAKENEKQSEEEDEK